MTGSFVGADPEALRGLAARLGQDAGRLAGIADQLQRALSTAPWLGQRADAYRQEFSSRHMPALRSAVGALQEAGAALTEQASQQDRASATDGGGDGPSVLGASAHVLSAEAKAGQKVIEKVQDAVDLAKDWDDGVGLLGWALSHDHVIKDTFGKVSRSPKDLWHNVTTTSREAFDDGPVKAAKSVVAHLPAEVRAVKNWSSELDDLKPLGVVGKSLGVIGYAGDGYDVITGFASHDMAKVAWGAADAAIPWLAGAGAVAIVDVVTDGAAAPLDPWIMGGVQMATSVGLQAAKHSLDKNG